MEGAGRAGKKRKEQAEWERSVREGTGAQRTNGRNRQSKVQMGGIGRVGIKYSKETNRE
jgi:hypothetical protein